MIDGFAKSPFSALRFTPRHCDVLDRTPHSSEFARLETVCKSIFDGLITISRFVPLFLFVAMLLAGVAQATSLTDMMAQDARIMVVFRDVGNGEDFLEYGETILKKAIKEAGGNVIDPDVMQKVKEDRLLWQAIKDGNATAMARISTDFGAGILIRGSLSVDSRRKFGESWEGTASLTVIAVNTRTAEEIAHVNSDPFGTTVNPSPIEESPLVARQMAVKKVCADVSRKLGVSDDDGDLRAARTISLELYDLFPVKGGKPEILVFLSGGDALAVGAGNKVEVWSLTEKKHIYSYTQARGRITALAGSPDGKRLAIGDSGGYVHVWQPGAETFVFREKKHSGEVSALAYRPDGQMIASAGTDRIIRLIAPDRGLELGALEKHTDRIHSCAFSPDGRYLISAGNDLSIRWWDVNVFKHTKAIQESADKLLKMVLSRDGNAAALSTVDIHVDLVRRSRKDVRHVRVRDTVTGEEVRTLEGHKKDIVALGFHPSRRFLASGGEDKTVYIWDVQTGSELAAMNMKSDVLSVDFSDDGKWFAAAAADGRVTVWKIR